MVFLPKLCNAVLFRVAILDPSWIPPSHFALKVNPVVAALGLVNFHIFYFRSSLCRADWERICGPFEVAPGRRKRWEPVLESSDFDLKTCVFLWQTLPSLMIHQRISIAYYFYLFLTEDLKTVDKPSGKPLVSGRALEKDGEDSS